MHSKKKRFIALFLAILVFSINVAVAEVQAETIHNDAITDVLVAVGAVIGTETALAYALGALGFTAASVAVYENRDSLVDWCENVKEDFIDFCAKTDKWVDVTGEKIQNWLEGIGTGVLDKADDTWLALKDFCVDIFNKQKAGDVSIDDGKIISVENFSEWISKNYEDLQSLNDKSDIFVRKKISDVLASHSSLEHACNLREYEECNYISSAVNYRKLNFACLDSEIVCFDFGDGSSRFFCISTQAFEGFNSKYLYNFPYISGVWEVTDGSSANAIPFDSSDEFAYYYNRYSFFPFDFCGTLFYTGGDSIVETSKHVTTYDLGVPYTDLRYKYGLDISTINSLLIAIATGLVNGYSDWEISIPKDDGISEERTGDYVVDGSVEDVIERDGSLDYVDVINPGNVDDDKVWVDVGGITIEDIAKPFPDDGTITIDSAADVILPDGEPMPRTDEDDSLDEFTLDGLEKLFPFCVPFDIKSLFETLSADAKAPKFKWEFVYYDSKGKKKEEVEIDLSLFDSVALVFRTMELMAFIVGLLLFTKNTILNKG